MVTSEFVHILKNSDEIKDHNALDFKSIIEAHPYFQAARVLYLKTLKKQESFKYNFELKKTAAYTTDRSVLFDYITAKKKLERISKSIENIEVALEVETQTASVSEDHPVVSQSQEDLVEIAKEELALGKPLDFNIQETYSFHQWLQLTSKKTIERGTERKKSEKEIIIDTFISTNPKISPLKKSANFIEKPIDTSVKANELMTETLAKVYLEQKKYTNAIKAYEILSLKYPEKSGFFADQIKRIKIIQNNK